MTPILDRHPVSPHLRSLLQWAHLGVVVAVSPLLLFPRLDWMAVAFLVPGFWFLNFLLSRRFLPSTPLNALLLPLAFMVLISTWATFDLEFSLGKVAGTLLGFFLFLALVDWADNWSRFWWLTAGFGLLGALFAFAAFLITPFRPKIPLVGALVSWLPPRIDLPVPEGSLNANPVGGTLVLLLPVLLLTGLTRLTTRIEKSGHRRLGWSALGAALAGLGVLVLSQSRGAWAGMGAALVLFLAFRYRWVRWTSIPLFLVGVLILVTGLPGEGLGFAAESYEFGGELGLSSRLELWDRALYGIQDFPFTGMGMNAFRRIVHLLYPPFLVPPDLDIASAHNQVLQTALDLGIPGLVAYLGIWVAVGRMLWLSWVHSSDRMVRATAVGLGAGLAAQFFYLLTDAIPLGAKLGGFWWIAVALAVICFRLVGVALVPSQWRSLELLLTWMVVSLLSISFAGAHPAVSLGVAIAGSAYLGFLAVPSICGVSESAQES